MKRAWQRATNPSKRRRRDGDERAEQLVTFEYSGRSGRISFTFTAHDVAVSFSMDLAVMLGYEADRVRTRSQQCGQSRKPDSSERENQQRVHLLRPVGARFGGRHENATAAHRQQEDPRQTSARQCGTRDVQRRAVRTGAEEMLRHRLDPDDDRHRTPHAVRSRQIARSTGISPNGEIPVL